MTTSLSDILSNLYPKTVAVVDGWLLFRGHELYYRIKNGTSK
jgi:hypothetical protein